MLASLFLALQTLAPRDVVAPPSDILAGVVRLPDAELGASASKATIAALRFVRSESGWQADVPFHAGGACELALLSPAAARWKVFAAPVGRALRDLDGNGAPPARVELAGEFLPGYVLAQRRLPANAQGAWTLRVVAERAEDLDAGWLFVSDGSPVRAQAWLDAHGAVRGEPQAIVARLDAAANCRVLDGWLELECAGAVRTLPLHDDGQHGDAAAADGRWGAWLPSELLGEVIARAHLVGVTARGERVQRSVPLAFVVHEPALVLDGTARAEALPAERLELALGAQLLDTPRRLQVSAEVWSTGAHGPVPACWISRLLEPELERGRTVLKLRFDARWLDLAGAGARIELRNVRVQDPDTCAVLEQAASIPVQADWLAARVPSSLALSTSALLAQNLAPVGPFSAFQGERALQPGLVLTHGYCSTGAIWPASQFTAPKYVFLDLSANRSHDQFAQLIGSRADLAGFSSFGIVGHSQGGCAALQLLTYYTSGLDLATGGRRIQSVATPYLGTPLASLGFFTCGTNSNLTPGGATTWLAGIPTWARAEVSYWTTANSGSACNALAAILLADPEDGTVERTRGQLSGANSMGHVPGWCHTTGMSQPAGYLDGARNVQMNAAAAR